MASMGKYLYGLIRTEEDWDLGAVGLECEGAPARVHSVRVGTVAAIVSNYVLRGKIPPLRRNLEPHNRVIQEVMKRTTIVPMAFGHVAKSELELQKTLKRNVDAVEVELGRVEGKVEMGLKIRWDVENIAEYFVSTDDELKAYRDEIFGRSRAPSQPEKLELGRMFERVRDREREEHAERVAEACRAIARDVKVNPPKGEKAVADLAFLVEREKVPAFEQLIYQVAGTFPAQYVFDYSGPWAPFNFVALEFQVGRSA